MAFKAREVKISDRVQGAVKSIINHRGTNSGSIVERAKIFRMTSEGHTNAAIANQLQIHRDTVSKWRQRIADTVDLFERVAERFPEALESLIVLFLGDEERSGRPTTYSAEQKTWIVRAATKKPSDFGYADSTWTCAMLADCARKEGIAENISPATVWRSLVSALVKPWLSQYWLHSAEKDKDPIGFWEKIKEICSLYLAASAMEEEGHHLVSVDEMTGIQALERRYPDKPPQPGSPMKTEFEYIRHGTVTLIAGIHVASGKIVLPFLNPTRTEEDYVAAIKQLIETDPEARWTFIHDGLNTHKSEGLVRMVAELCGIEDDLGIKGKEGILHNMKTRAEFLSDKSHRIRFVFTPAHSSWVNQIECWFSILTRRLLKRGSFTSKEELTDSIRNFIDAYNPAAKPFKWKYRGQPKAA